MRTLVFVFCCLASLAAAQGEKVEVVERVGGIDVKLTGRDEKGLYVIKVSDGKTTSVQTFLPDPELTVDLNRLDSREMLIVVQNASRENQPEIYRGKAKTLDALTLMLDPKESVSDYLAKFDRTAESLGMTEPQKEAYLHAQRMNVLRQAANKAQQELEELTRRESQTASRRDVFLRLLQREMASKEATKPN